MNFISYLLLILISAFSMAACKKNHSVNIQAVDLNNGTENAYAGIDFAIVQSRPGWKTDKFKRVYEGVFDKNGHASFDLKMQKNWSYILTMDEPGNICYSEAFGIRLNNEKSNVIAFNYAKCGTIELILHNVDCFDANDKLEYARTWLTNNEKDEITTILGCQELVSNNYEFSAGLYNCLWTVTKNNISTSFSEDFTITAGENTTFAINY